MEAEFACVNFDFIYGLPGQTAESLSGSLERAMAFSPDEIFLYPLYQQMPDHIPSPDLLIGKQDSMRDRQEIFPAQIGFYLCKRPRREEISE